MVVRSPAPQLGVVMSLLEICIVLPALGVKGGFYEGLGYWV